MWEKILLIVLSISTPIIGFFLKRHMTNVDRWVTKQQDLENKLVAVTTSLIDLQKQMQQALDNQAALFNVRVDNIHNTMIEIKEAIVEQQKILQHMDKNAAVAGAAIERFMKLEDRILALEREKKVA